MMGGADFDWIEMQGESQGKIKRVSANERSASFMAMSKECSASLKELIKTYKGGDFKSPQQITYNGRHSTPQNISCDCFAWSECNPIIR